MRTYLLGLAPNVKNERTKDFGSIEQFAKKKVSRNMIMRLIMRKSDVGSVQEFRETLRHSLDLFGVGIDEFPDNVFRLMIL